jgi:hypothetical protein
MNSAIPIVADYYRVLPELIWCGFGVLAMLLQPFARSRHFFSALAIIGASSDSFSPTRSVFSFIFSSAQWRF